MDIDSGASSPASIRVERISAMEEISIMVEKSGRDESDAMEGRDTPEDNDENMGENDSNMDVQDPADQFDPDNTLAIPSSTRRSARDARPSVFSSTSSASPSVKKTKTKETHMHTILREALPEGSVVSQDTLERLAKAFTSIVKEASVAAAKAAVNKARATNGPRAANGPHTAKRAVRKGRVTKLTTTPKKAGTGPKEKKTQKKKKEEDDQEEEDKLEDGEEEAEEEEDEDEEEVFEVESILEHKFVRGKILFKIKWSGYPVSQSTWETKTSLDGCKDLLQAYAKKNKLTI